MGGKLTVYRSLRGLFALMTLGGQLLTTVSQNKTFLRGSMLFFNMELLKNKGQSYFVTSRTLHSMYVQQSFMLFTSKKNVPPLDFFLG